MNVTEIPFNRFLGIKQSEKPGYLLMLNSSENYLNHLGTVHATVQFALAEATSGQFLFNVFKEYSDNVIPVVRRAEIKYSKPANGELFSKAEIDAADIEKVRTNLSGKGRCLIKVKVTIYDLQDNLTLQSVYEWYVQKIQ